MAQCIGYKGKDCANDAMPRSKTKVCRSCYYKGWYEANKEKRRASSLAWYHEHKDDPKYRELIRTWRKNHYEAHKDEPEYKRKQRERANTYYHEHKNDPEFMAKNHERQKRWRDENKNRSKAIFRRWYDKVKNTPEFKAKNAAKARNWYDENREYVKERNKARRSGKRLDKKTFLAG